MLNPSHQWLRIQLATEQKDLVVKPSNDKFMLKFDWDDIILFLSSKHLSNIKIFKIKYINVKENRITISTSQCYEI